MERIDDRAVEYFRYKYPELNFYLFILDVYLNAVEYREYQNLLNEQHIILAKYNCPSLAIYTLEDIMYSVSIAAYFTAWYMEENGSKFNENELKIASKYIKLKEFVLDKKEM